jgi:hypothetical protein
MNNDILSFIITDELFERRLITNESYVAAHEAILDKLQTYRETLKVPGLSDTEIYYGTMLSENETLNMISFNPDTNEAKYEVEFKPIIRGSLTGTIYYGHIAVQTFIMDENGYANIVTIGTPWFRAESIGVSCNYGTIIVKWNKKPESTTSLHVSYEYPREPAPQQYPKDDEFSIQQGDHGGNANLSIWYSSQFVQNENSKVIPMPFNDIKLEKNQTYHWLEYTPVMAGTLVGTISYNEEVVQTFAMQSDGSVIFQPPVDAKGPPKNFVTKLTLNCNTGEIYMTWNKEPRQPIDLVVSYEYNME